MSASFAGPLAALAQVPVSYVQPINWSKYNGMFGVQAGDTFGQGLVSVLQNESRFELTSIPAQYPVANDGFGYPGVDYYYAFTNYSSYGYEQSLRPLSGFAYGTATLIATGTYSPGVGGMSQSQALHEVELAIRGVAFAHRANHQSTGLQFGGRGTSSDKWEAALWASQAAEAAWFVWDQLTPDTRTVVAKMVEYEANSFTTYAVPYWKNPNGSTNSFGDTKAEENAWNGHMVAVAQAMMPNHPNVTQWRTKASELQVSAFSRQSDNTSLTLVDGKTAMDWLGGFNSFSDGVVVNHNRVHPDYMASIFGQTASVIDESLAGQPIPQSTVFNFNSTYQALTELQFTPGSDTKYGTGTSINSPGGTIYKRTAANGYDWAVYYPQGNDWTNQVTDSYLNTDLTAEWLGLDAGKSFDSMGWAQARVTQLAFLQNRAGHNGNIYQAGDWFVNYHGFDEVIYQSNAAAWLQWWLMENNQMSPVSDNWGTDSVPQWASPGVGPNIVDGGNWVGGVAPNLAGDATTDSAVFSASTNTAVELRNVATGDPFVTLTFDTTAPAYSFSLPTGNTTNELVILPGGSITNNSSHTQSFTGVSAVSINSATGQAGALVANSGNAGTKLSFDLSQLKFNNGGGTTTADLSTVDLSAGFDVRAVSFKSVVNGGVSSTLRVVGNTTDGTGGTLFFTGDSGGMPGRIIIDTGAKVRISHNNALGSATGTNNETRLGSGGTNNGRVELTGNITVNEDFRLGARQNNQPLYDNNHSPHILNISGNNTLTGGFRFDFGGNSYNFGSNGGTLTVQSDLSMPNSGERYYTFQGTGNMVFNGNFISGPNGGGNNVDMTLVKFDSGTTTLNGSASTFVGHLMIYNGTLALGAAAGVTFAPLADDSHVAPVVFIDAPGKFDVSAKVGGFALTRSVLGNGTVVGSLIMTSGTRVVPGGTVTRDSQNLAPVAFGDAVGKLTFQSGGGDYNTDGKVDAADYLLWRKNSAGFGGDPAGYDTWRVNFGATVAAGLNLSAGSIFAWQLGALSTSNPGVDFDQMVVGGNLTLGGTSNLTLDFSLVSGPIGGSPFWNSVHSWKIIDTTTNTGSTNFASITNGTFTLGHFTTTVGTGANVGDIFLNYLVPGSGAAIPEPATQMLMLLGALGALLVRKR